ncbi:MAG TPA: hypothetical protein DCY13_08520 [Verrucomicrobiales bacterium]|nr:hypothetical protein [Verrucomicrobiales bacterium]
MSVFGNNGDRFVVEASGNLTNWFYLYSGVATGGQLAFTIPSLNIPPQQFFRAYSGSAEGPPGITVTPETDTNQTVTTLITLNGGGSDLYLAGPGRISLQFPSNVVAQATQVTMTLATNVGSLPFARGILGAVMIEPDDLATIGAATLEFTFDTPPGFDRRQVVSFMANLDGTGFQLLPSRVGTNTARIAISRGGLYGSCLAENSELELLAVAATARPSPRLQGIARPRPLDTASASGYLNASQLCFPERIAATEAILADLETELAAVSHRIGLQLAASRRAQLAGTTDEGLPVHEIGLEGCIFYHDRISPLFPMVESNCSLLTGLAGIALGISRQLQLIGYSDCPSATSLADLPICAGARACLQEIEQCCAQKPQERDKLRIDLVSIIRQQELLGIENQPGCFDLGHEDVEQILQHCSDLIWSGSVKIKETGTVSEIDEHFFRDRVRQTVFEGVVTDEFVFGDTVLLTVTGHLEHLDKLINIRRKVCPGFDGHHCGDVATVSEYSATGRHALSIMLGVTTNGSGANYALSIGNSGTAHADLRRGEHGYEVVNCNTCVKESFASNELFPGSAITPSLVFHQGSSNDTNSFQGASTMEGQFDKEPSQISFHWNFTRKKAPE